MAEVMTEPKAELNNLRYASFPQIFNKIRELSDKYGDLPIGTLYDAFGLASRGFDQNPFVQNRRVKAIGTRPANYSKDQIGKFIQNPEASEQPLRAVEHALEYSAYALFHLRMTYQNLLTYHSYIAPSLTDKSDAKDDSFWREWKLLEKLRKKINPKDTCHTICGQALQEGKVFYVPRVKADKSHNKIDHAFVQQLPSDYTKIVGFNNVSKYTVAFNMMYFMQFGTTPKQFGDLFDDYLYDFYNAVKKPEGLGTKVVYSSIDMKKVAERGDSRVDAYFQNGKWCYWVTLPVDKVFTFEIDDTNRNVLPVFTGLFIEFVQLAQLQALQLELLQNPLVSILTGEIPYWDNKSDNTADDYKLSNAGRVLFEQLWYQMLAQNSTSGIGLYAAPFENIKLETLDEAPGAANIVSQNYTDIMGMAGVNAIIPASDEARAGAVNVSYQIESQFPKCIYRCYERMMDAIISKLNLNYDWEFKMFGDLASDKDKIDSLRSDMSLGILPATIEYNAIMDRSVLDDIAWSDAVLESKLLDRRIPLVSSYSMKQESSGLPPQGGRPQSEDAGSSDGHEQDADGGT